MSTIGSRKSSSVSTQLCLSALTAPEQLYPFGHGLHEFDLSHGHTCKIQFSYLGWSHSSEGAYVCMHRDISEHGTCIFSRDASIEIRFGCHAADTSFECHHTTSPPKADGVKLGSSEEIVA